MNIKREGGTLLAIEDWAMIIARTPIFIVIINIFMTSIIWLRGCVLLLKTGKVRLTRQHRITDTDDTACDQTGPASFDLYDLPPPKQN